MSDILILLHILSEEHKINNNLFLTIVEILLTANKKSCVKWGHVVHRLHKFVFNYNIN